METSPRFLSYFGWNSRFSLRFVVTLPSDHIGFHHICLTNSWLSSRKSNIWFSWSLTSCLAISMAFSHIWGRENKQTASKSERQIGHVHSDICYICCVYCDKFAEWNTIPKQQLTYFSLVQIAHDLLEQSLLQLLLRPARSSVPRDQVGCARLVQPLQRLQKSVMHITLNLNIESSPTHYPPTWKILHWSIYYIKLYCAVVYYIICYTLIMYRIVFFSIITTI